MRRFRAVTFADWESKAKFLDGAATLDARFPVVRDMARRITRSRNPNDYQGAIGDLFTYVQKRVKYVNDPQSEEFSDAQQVLESLEGDCDDKVRAFVGMVRSLYNGDRVQVAVRPVLRVDDFAHVQAVVRWPGSVAFRPGTGGWVTAEVILRDAKLGDDVQDVPSLALS